MGKTIEELLKSGEDALEKRDYKTAMADYKAAADMGSVEAFVCLGRIYNEGFACRRNPALSTEYFQKAADMGNHDGMYGLARAYSCGYGVDLDGKKAIEWLKKAANNGNIKAMVNLAQANIYHLGTSLLGNIRLHGETDLEGIIFWYNKAVEQAEKTDKSFLAFINYKIATDIACTETTDKAVLDFARKCAEQALKLGHKKASEIFGLIEDRDTMIEAVKAVKAEAPDIF